jgi:putative AbiEi antitoxin of type IV toxin-antitoxin system
VTGGPGRVTVGGMSREIPVAARELIDGQHGVLTLAQAHACGLTDKYVVAALRAGRWQRLHAGVYGAFSGPPPRRTQLWAAVLRVGSETVLSHHSAAELYGLLSAPAPATHVMVSRGRRVAPIAGIVVHHTAWLDQVRHPALTPPRTRIEETVLDLAVSAASLDDALGWVLRACGSRRTTPDRLAAVLARRARVRWRAELSAALGLAADGVHSLLEFRYVNRVERPHGLPAARRQRSVVRAGQRQYQDVTYQEYGLVVELDGQVAHPAESRWRDVRRDNANTAVGQGTLRYGWADVTERPCFVAGQVAATLAARGWTGVLRRCGRSCGLAGTGRAGT